MSYQDEHRYDDIINLPHHVSSKHPQMAPLDRAAQFSPFAALTGHGAAIKETARLTDAHRELDEDSKEQIDRCLQEIREHLAERPKITIRYFEPDMRKEGGSYCVVSDRVKKIDAYEHRILFEGGKSVGIEEICFVEWDRNIYSEIFNY